MVIRNEAAYCHKKEDELTRLRDWTQVRSEFEGRLHSFTLLPIFILRQFCLNGYDFSLGRHL